VTKKKVRKIKTGSVEPSKSTGTKGVSPGRDAVKPSGTVGGVSSSSPGTVARLKEFLLDVREELHKITWPTMKETRALAIAVLSITIFFALYLGLVDLVLSKLVSLVLA